MLPPLIAYPILIGLLFIMTACIPPPEEGELTGVVIDLNDEKTQRIYNLQNERRSDSLLTYLADPNASYRYLAATALASFPTLDVMTRDSLAGLLDDPENLVRTVAAYALGQTGDEDQGAILTTHFDSEGIYQEYNGTLLAAVGRTGDQTDLENIAGVTTYTPTDTSLVAGQAWSIYYFGLRGITDARATDLIIDYVADLAAPREIRHPAAHFLHRIEVPLDTGQVRQLRQLLRNETDPIVAMGIIRALGRSGEPAARVALLRRSEEADDWRERVEVIRALAGFEYSSVRESIIEALRDPHPLIATTAADFLIDHGVEEDAVLYRELAQESFPPAIQTALYRAANRHLSPFLTDYRDRITYALRQNYEAAESPYRKADIIRALGEFAWMYRVIYDMYQATTSPVVRSAAVETLGTISEREDFDAFFRGSSKRVRYELSTYFQRFITGREVGPAYFAANALGAKPDIYRIYYPDLNWLDGAVSGFSLPKEIETYNAVTTARAKLEGTDSEPVPSTAAARPIDWDLLLGQASKEVQIRTSEGRIVLQLWPQAAPATVSSFLELVGEGYYDGKVFHRIVPNFVAQGGGPRGDGFGSEDFIVRTETPMVSYDRAGLVGMASAGKDTEGVQFFITHRPTPHLNGGYTIFGEVIEGQEVVDRLLPGTVIEEVLLR